MRSTRRAAVVFCPWRRKILCAALLVTIGTGWAVAQTPLSTAASASAPVKVWAVDVHAKVLRDARPADKPGAVALRAARNEYESGQLAVRSAVPLRQMRVELSALRRRDGKASIAPEHLAWHFVGYIPIKKNTQGAEAIRVAAAPCEIPDPLLEARTMDLPAESTQPVWLTVFVPKDTVPGVYQGEVVVIAGEHRASVPIELSVDSFVLPDERHLLVTNWFSVENIARAHRVPAWSDAFWPVLEQYARNMAAHRQNVFYVPWGLVKMVREADGKLSFDYGRFDRFVELFQKAGVADGIEIYHVAHFKKGWGSEIELSKVHATDRQTGKAVVLNAAEGMVPLLGDLERHLDQRGWLSKAMIHVADEPCISNVASWREVAEVVHRAAPRLRRIEAIESVDFSGSLEIWVPKLSHFDRWREAFDARRGDGEFWYYICCHPTGSIYPNRFLDYPSTSVRVLHWLNYSQRLTGYLHWGLNFWGAEPFGTPSAELPPGDTHVIYPGSAGPIDSIRWEIQREGLEDFEYLWLLESKTAALKKRLAPSAAWLDPRRRAMELCRRVAPAIAECERDPARILDARKAIADEIVALEESPLVLVATEPADGTTVVAGPVVVEVRGVTEPGTKVKINGHAVEVSSAGAFQGHLWGGSGRIEVQHDGKTKTLLRNFPVRK